MKTYRLCIRRQCRKQIGITNAESTALQLEEAADVHIRHMRENIIMRGTLELKSIMHAPVAMHERLTTHSEQHMWRAALASSHFLTSSAAQSCLEGHECGESMNRSFETQNNLARAKRQPEEKASVINENCRIVTQKTYVEPSSSV